MGEPKAKTPSEYEKEKILELLEQIRKSPVVAIADVIFCDEMDQLEERVTSQASSIALRGE